VRNKADRFFPAVFFALFFRHIFRRPLPACRLASHTLSLIAYKLSITEKKRKAKADPSRAGKCYPINYRAD
jgi:hypothetical protein